MHSASELDAVKPADDKPADDKPASLEEPLQPVGPLMWFLVTLKHTNSV